jgi:hypothetical protein
VGIITAVFIPLGFIFKGVTKELLDWRKGMTIDPKSKECNRNSLTFWLEMICFVGLFLCVGLYYLKIF